MAASVSQDKIANVRTMRENGMTYAEIGREFGCSKQNIEQVIRKYLPELKGPCRKYVVCSCCGGAFPCSDQPKFKLKGDLCKECYKEKKRCAFRDKHRQRKHFIDSMKLGGFSNVQIARELFPDHKNDNTRNSHLYTFLQAWKRNEQGERSPWVRSKKVHSQY